MSTKFRGQTRGLIRGLANRLKQVQAADARETAAAEKAGRVPLLLGSSPNIRAAVTTMLTRCQEALAAS